MNAISDGDFLCSLRALTRVVRVFFVGFRVVAALAVLRMCVRDSHAYLCKAGVVACDACRAVARIMGMRIHLCGPVPSGNVFLAPNHTGYGDILALGAATGCFFVPKAEIMGWPGIGTLARLSGQVASSRRARRDLAATGLVIADRLRGGHSVCVFLEGTSTGGDRVLPFRSSFLQSAIDTGSAVVPVAIRWKGDPGVDPTEGIAYWRAEHHFASHFWRFLGMRGVEAEIRFGAALQPAPDADRKALSRELHGCVVSMLGGAVAVSSGGAAYSAGADLPVRAIP